MSPQPRPPSGSQSTCYNLTEILTYPRRVRRYDDGGCVARFTQRISNRQINSSVAWSCMLLRVLPFQPPATNSAQLDGNYGPLSKKQQVLVHKTADIRPCGFKLFPDLAHLATRHTARLSPQYAHCCSSLHNIFFLYLFNLNWLLHFFLFPRWFGGGGPPGVSWRLKQRSPGRQLTLRRAATVSVSPLVLPPHPASGSSHRAPVRGAKFIN